tara:strand:- start:1867 stop:2142 length:276 start_codon:yes stop_codon:yes gene_type:complete
MELEEKRETIAEKLWIIIFQVIGLILFIAPLYLPVRAYFLESKEDVPLTLTGVAIAVIGIFLARGGKAVGTVINNLGVIIIDFLKRISNTK